MEIPSWLWFRVPGTDFYRGYDWYTRPHLRCWVHFRRDVYNLAQSHPPDRQVQQWAARFKQLDGEAITQRGARGHAASGAASAWRRRRQRASEERLAQRCARFADQAVPQRVLCARVMQYLPGLRIFIADPRVPADDNGAERSIRRVAMCRTISGGTRSRAGAATHVTL
jgi:hypothetical protein